MKSKIIFKASFLLVTHLQTILCNECYSNYPSCSSSPSILPSISLIPSPFPTYSPTFAAPPYIDNEPICSDFCEFTNDIEISLGTQDGLLDDRNNRRSMENILTKWINDKRDCEVSNGEYEGYEEEYFVFEIDANESVIKNNKRRRGRGRGRCRGKGCPRNVKFSRPKMIITTCDTNLLEEIQKKSEFANVAFVSFETSNGQYNDELTLFQLICKFFYDVICALCCIN